MNNKKHRGPGSGPLPVEKAKDFKGTIKKLIISMSDYKIPLIIIFVFAIGSTIFSIIGPKILGNAITELYAGIMNKLTGGTGINFGKISNILISLLILYLISAVFNYIQGYIMSNVSQKYTYKLRKQVSEKIKKIPLSYYEKRNTGEVLSIITNDIDTLSHSLNQSATQLITCIVTIVGILIMMLSINVTMTIISLLILPLSIIITSFIVKKSQKHFTDQQNYLAEVNGEVEEMLSGHSVVKAFNAEDKMISKFESDNKKLCEAAWKSQFQSGLMHPIMTFVGNIGYVLVAICGGYFCISGKITVGDIQSFISYTKSFTHPIAQIAQAFNMIQSMVAAAERVFEFLELKEEKEVVNPEKINHIKGNVQFKHVKFGYKKNQIIINDFNIKVKQGQKIAIVGPTGAGKTTMVKLLMRFYNVTDGEILIDGKNVNKFKRSELRKIFGMVLQDTWLFNGTIMENLRYGKLEATDEEVKKAAKTAKVDRFIKTLPEGYSMVLNEEADNISQGQKQLLTIARAILADPKVLILDEATSSVDTRTEIQIQQAMDALMKGRTSFIIAHRLSTIKNADLILVMNNGDIVEQGTHDELLEKNGFYADLYNSQFETI